MKFNNFFKSLVLICFLSLPISAIAETGKFVDYQVGSKTYEGYYISENKNNPLIMMVHDWDGITSYEIERAKMLSNKGYNVFLVDMYGKGVRPQAVADKKALTSHLYKNRDEMQSLMTAALNEINQLGYKDSTIIAAGYCFGGTAVLEMARNLPQVNGYVVFHGGLQTPEGQDYKKVKSKILVFQGGIDKVSDMKTFADLSNLLNKDNVNNEMIVYGGARHAFTVPNSDRYNKKADELSWTRFLEFIQNQNEKTS